MEVILVEVEFLKCHEEKNFLRPPWEDEVSWKAFLKM